jgi:phosphoribosylglycinamide formyltransferase-1
MMFRPRKRVAVLISGRGSNLKSLITAGAKPDYPAAIELVLSNEPTAGGIQMAGQAGIPTVIVDHRKYLDRETFERVVAAHIDQARIDVICLAGFMRVLTPWFVGHYAGRILNIHPSLLPAFKGLHTHERALATGVKTHGATVHVVSAALDDGPMVAQAPVDVLDDDTPETLAKRVLEAEHTLYPRALELFLGGLPR